MKEIKETNGPTIIRGKNMGSPDVLWEGVMKKLSDSVSSSIFETWMSTLYLSKIDDKEMTIGVPNEFVRSWIQEKYKPIILSAIKTQDTSIRSIRFIVSRGGGGINRVRTIRKNYNPRQEEMSFGGVAVDRHRNLNQKYTFENFVKAPYNELALAAAHTIVNKLGIIYNPFFVYGSTGVGKTHLIQAIGNKVAKLYPDRKIYYTTSEEFANDYYSAVQTGKTTEFKEKYRFCDVLMMDDIQFFDNQKQKTMEQLFHLFNFLYDNNKQIIFSADKHPGEIEGLEDRLKSRFSAGMVLDLPNPDSESKGILLRAKAKELGVALGETKKDEDEIVKHIISCSESGVRYLEGILNTIKIHSDVYKNTITPNNIKKIVNLNSRTRNFNYKDVIKKVSDFYEVDPELVIKKTRKKDVVQTRQIIMYLLREHMDYPYSSIGLKLGGKDHTTVIHSCEKIKKQIEENVMLKNEVEKIKRMLNI